MHGVTPSKSAHAAFTPRAREVLAIAAVAMLPLLAACSEQGPTSPQVPSTGAPQQAIKHGPFFPECGGVSDEEMIKQTEVAGLINTAKTSVGCQWLSGGSIVGPHFSFTWFRGSPIGRERKTEELSRTSVENINIEGHDGFIALNEDPTLGTNLCEVGIQFDDDFIEWSISFAQEPFPDACGVAKELTRQSIVNSK
ncbi:hypothetical protein NGTWS0302_02310 [Mycolicibacterium cyprinidarum]|uniref:DUF3558 domain-containing protein n=1 Tax=Mycolicibacterium cyprinidarum TaxID=2860311 RepID=A0ABQ4V8Y6_9MYCO|nr:hypothetical protein NGTWS1702_10230 [Mycolicibacterium sp. NGTWSNA01]GJF12634.1 hypothetical protein NGTWS0302_02310 [Mycolicibacterium sp. NGTWS0302]